MSASRRTRLIFLAAALLAGTALGAWLLPAHPDGEALPRWAASPSSSYDGRRAVFAGRRDTDGTAGIWEMRIGGSEPSLVTAGNGAPSDPSYLPDGRILYSDAAAPVEAGAEAARALYSCRADGTEAIRLTFGAHIDSRPEVLPDGRILFERRFRSGPAARPSMWMTIHPDGTQIAFHDDGAGRGVIAAAQAAGRPVPPILTSVVKPDRHTGTLLCLNAYQSRPGVLAQLAPGTIRAVLVRRAASVPSEAAGDSPGETLGQAPVLADGSFFIEVPADVPLRLTLLDADGRALASLDSGIWVRGNENRGCIGCHEEPDLAPQNRRPLAIASSPVPLPGPPSGGGAGDAR